MKLFGLDIQREAQMRVPGAISPMQVREATAATDTQTTATQTVRSANFADKSVRVNSQERALAVSAWYCGLATKANTFAQLILEYQKRNDKAHGLNYEMYSYGHAATLNFLTQVQPNPLMSAHDMMAQAVIDREVFGNAIFYIERDEYAEVKYIWLCRTGTLNIATMEYTITYDYPGVGPISRIVPHTDIIHWPNTYRHNNRIQGIGTLRYAAGALSTAATNDQQAMEIAAKGGKYKILLKEEQQADFALNLLNKEQRNAARDEMQEAFNNGDDVISVNGLITPTVISQTAQEMNLLDERKWDVPTIARFLQMPLVLLMDYTNNTYKAPEQAMQAFLQHTIAPMAQELEMEFNAKLVGKSAYPTLRFHFNNANLTRLDPKGSMEIAKMQLECGIKCVNELRRDFDLPAIKDGDTHLVSTNLQRLDDIKVGKNQAQPEGDKAKGQEGDKANNNENEEDK